MEQNEFISNNFKNDEKYFEKIIGIFATISFLNFFIYFFTNKNSFFGIISSISYFSSINLYHLFKITRDIFPKFIMTAGYSQRLILSHDVHLIILTFVFIFSNYTPFLYLINYFLITSSDSISFLINLLYNNTKIKHPIFNTLLKITSSSLIKFLTSYIEIILCFQFLYQLFINFSFKNFIIFLFFFFLVILSGLSCSENHKRIWENTGLYFREIASKNYDTFGFILESLIDSFNFFNKFAEKIFPKNDLKVHLQ